MHDQWIWRILLPPQEKRTMARDPWSIGTIISFNNIFHTNCFLNFVKHYTVPYYKQGTSHIKKQWVLNTYNMPLLSFLGRCPMIDNCIWTWIRMILSINCIKTNCNNTEDDESPPSFMVQLHAWKEMML